MFRRTKTQSAVSVIDVRLTAHDLATNEIESAEFFSQPEVWIADLEAYLVEHADEWASHDEGDTRYIIVIQRFFDRA
ncbi:hypothetical protein [Microbacterium sp. SORGH_AS_0888]|uniref:hypothetical protein n=1 Tax=Microbacterium sp. SORGH_AS_0888 TaxID=3041791 RepID=UPI002780D629|nr:hypothetical protein [Microbacterium sp. SORGH_AS_0888]MDQ1130937.1 hypothetical protein [Microbacterium sp. SORGH_AS_0888]